MKGRAGFRGSRGAVYAGRVRWAWKALAAGIVAAATLHGQTAGMSGEGVAWAVQGTWVQEGHNRQISTGDPLHGGELLHPVMDRGRHSITVLLPDGQRVLYECYQAADCDRDFRVPELFEKPDPFAVEMLAKIRAALKRRPGISQEDSALQSDEQVAEVDAGNRVQPGGLVSTLPDGRYLYDVAPPGQAAGRRPSHPMEKKGRLATIEVPGPGLYDVTIFDELYHPRIDLLVLAVRGKAKAEAQRRGLERVHATFREWNEHYQGWPAHAFQRAWLEAAWLDLKPESGDVRQAGVEKAPPGRVAEPIFSPRPGLKPDTTRVTISCPTPGAEIHFTVDASQPFATSPVYHAPIVVMGTALIIKAYATAPGKKDSPVVTGIYRIAGD